MADIKVLSATLLANHNTVQITDSIISNSSIFEVYVSNPDIICNNIVVGGNTANITFDSKPKENTTIKVMINNVSGALSISASEVLDGSNNQSTINTNLSNSINGKANITTLNERVPSETVLGGVLYHGTTGNEWKVLSGANVNYDSNTTVNEKLNECFTSVSSGKSIIADAITDKGVETSATDTFQTMADNIGQISSGGLEIVTAMENGQISTTSAYRHPIFTTPLEVNKKYLIKATLSGYHTGTYYTVHTFNDTTSTTNIHFTNGSFNIAITIDRVHYVTYSGSYYNQYLTIQALDISDF